MTAASIVAFFDGSRARKRSFFAELTERDESAAPLLIVNVSMKNLNCLGELSIGVITVFAVQLERRPTISPTRRRAQWHHRLGCCAEFRQPLVKTRNAFAHADLLPPVRRFGKLPRVRNV